MLGARFSTAIHHGWLVSVVLIVILSVSGMGVAKPAAVTAQSGEPAGLAGIAAGSIFYDGFESGSLGEDWSVYTTSQGRVQVSDTYHFAGSYSLLLDDSVYDATFSIAAAILAVDLSGQSQVELDFWWDEFDSTLTGDHAEDGVYISDDDGATWARIMSFDEDPSGWKHQLIDLDAAAAANSRTFNDQFQIKFQYYGDDPITYEGYAFDEIRVRPNAPPTLSWTGDTNYVTDGLNPETGYTDTSYVYRIEYQDIDGDAPAWVKVNILKGGIHIAGSPFPMSCGTIGYDSGVNCSYTRAGLEAGKDYTYYFTAQDDQGNSAAPTATLDAPDVSILHKVWLPMLMNNYGPVAGAPYLYPIDNPDGYYKFTVSWSEVERADTYTLQQDDNSYFSSPSTIYTGSSTSKLVTVSTPDRYYYRVKAANDLGESDWSNTQSTLVTVEPPPCPNPGWWAGPVSDYDGWVRFLVVESPSCLVDTFEVTLDVCGGTMTQTRDEGYLIYNNEFWVWDTGMDERIEGTFLSDYEAEGILDLVIRCSDTWITYVNETWEADNY